MVYSERTVRAARLSVWLVIGASVAGAQVYPGGYPPGGYPGGGYPYPGGGYPGGGGTGIPIPGRRPNSGQPKADPNQPFPNFRGKLKHMDDKTITLALGDDRVMDFRRTSKTKFFKNGDEIKTPQFAAGDQISIEGPEQADGSMTAVNVYWEKAGATPTATAGTTGSPQHSPDKDKADGVPDTWAKDAPSTAPAQSQSSANADPDRPVLKRAPSAESAPPAGSAPSGAPAPSAAPAAAQPQTAAVDTPAPADPDRPVLRRGKPADQSREQSGPVPYQANPPATPPLGPEPSERPVATASASGNPPVLRRANDDDAAPIVNRPIDETDQLIRRATDAALDFTESLPAYVCQEMMSRYQSETRPARFNALDVLTMNLVYENGKEDYRDLAINGKRSDKTLQESGGAWSTGEFGTVLIDLFAPATGANFQFQRESRIGGVPAKLYDFDVKRENSHWDVHAMSQTYSPAYKGSVWIDPQTARVLRIEMEAYNIPAAFPLDTVESATDYQYVRLGDAKQHLLPVHAENLSCQRGTPYCSKIVIDFRNYHKYQGESTITFGQPQQ
jgi:hypothetical protein